MGKKRIGEKTNAFFQTLAMRDHFEGDTTCFDYQSLFVFAKRQKIIKILNQF